MTTILTLTLAVTMAIMNPAKILAAGTTEPVYISEIRAGPPCANGWASVSVLR